MQAKQVFDLLQAKVDPQGFADFTLKGISADSRSVGKDFCFVAVDGTHADGHRFIPEAISRGARMIVYKNNKINALPAASAGVVFCGVEEPRPALGRISCAYFGYPADALVNIGITGTNGKTTTSYLIKYLLEQNSRKCGLIGTIAYEVADHVMPAKNTTPDAVKLQHILHHMVDHGITHNVMEVSSHALDQQRVFGINFQNAVFTNLTHDHLDYHHDPENYFLAKARLFEDLRGNACAVINTDDPYGARLKKMTRAAVIDYSLNDPKAVLFAENIDLKYDATRFNLVYSGKKWEVNTSLIGRHNVYNALAAAGVGIAQGVPLENIARAFVSGPRVPGRLERVDLRGRKQPAGVFIDYAHTDDALKNVLDCLRRLGPRKIITVFGCGGDRDKTKRPLMGKAASEQADYLLVTSDNPRSEDPQEIADQIVSGFRRGFKAFEVILDREKAIGRAMEIAGKEDLVLIAGKGHENYQIFKDRTEEFDDKNTVEKIIRG